MYSTIKSNQIMQVTGHKNIQLINNYSSINENQHKSISRILSNSEPRQLNHGSANSIGLKIILLKIQLFATQLPQTLEASRLLMSQGVSKIFWMGTFIERKFLLKIHESSCKSIVEKDCLWSTTQIQMTNVYCFFFFKIVVNLSNLFDI